MSQECSTANASKLIQTRAQYLSAVRDFFKKRNVLEVDTPLLSPYAPIDEGIEILETMATDSLKGYFHSSPEYAMKKLLSEGAPDIYQLSHVFRRSEKSDKHRVEFTMLEWYRINFSLQELMQETKELIFLFLGEVPVQCLDYQAIFKKAYNLDPFDLDIKKLTEIGKQKGLYGNLDPRSTMDFLFSLEEASFSKDCLTFVTNFPKELAYLAKTTHINQKEVALRFEAFYQGYELANGFDELQDSEILKKRFETALENRKAQQKPKLPMDLEFLACVDKLPDCVGVAVGFDRLLMLCMQKSHINEVTYKGI